jgi:hypothetical protein
MGEEKGRLVIRKLFEWLLGGRDQALEILEKTVSVFLSFIVIFPLTTVLLCL